MARDILSEYGPDSMNTQKPRATNGGQLTPKEPNYHQPMGPMGINDSKSPGLHGENCGPNGTQGKY